MFNRLHNTIVDSLAIMHLCSTSKRVFVMVVFIIMPNKIFLIDDKPTLKTKAKIVLEGKRFCSGARVFLTFIMCFRRSTIISRFV